MTDARFLCLFAGDAVVPASPPDATNVTRDVITKRAGAYTYSLGNPATPIADLPPSPYTQVLGFSLPEGAASAAKLAADLGAAVVCRVSTRVQMDRPIPPNYIKVVCFLRRRDDFTVEEFATHWNTTHGDLVLASEPRFTRYVTNVVRERSGDFPWDGIIEQWYSSVGELEQHIAPSRPGREKIAEDEPRFASGNEIYMAAPA